MPASCSLSDAILAACASIFSSIKVRLRGLSTATSHLSTSATERHGLRPRAGDLGQLAAADDNNHVQIGDLGQTVIGNR
jgi:hypothetical protein